MRICFQEDRNGCKVGCRVFCLKYKNIKQINKFILLLTRSFFEFIRSVHEAISDNYFIP